MARRPITTTSKRTRVPKGSPTPEAQLTLTPGAIARDLTAAASWVTLECQVDDYHWAVIPSHRNETRCYDEAHLKLITTPTLEDEFYHIWLYQGGPKLQRQVPLKKLIPGFKSRHVVDFYLEERKLVIEINGGTVSPKIKFRGSYCVRVSGHNSPEGIHKDYAKQNALGLSGYTVIELDTLQAVNGDVVSLLLANQYSDIDWSTLFS
jgi:very-short-patch-repair endonuclease